MLRSIKNITTILTFGLLTALPGFGQEDGDTPEDRYLQSRIEQNRFDRDRWSKLTEGIDFSERMRQSRQRRNNPDTRNAREFNPFWGEGTGMVIARFLLILLGAVIIALLVRSMLGYGGAKNKKIVRRTEDGINIKKIEENIHQADLDDFIEQAKAEGNFNLAIRLYYLVILKELSIRKDIRWKVDKTNNEYLREMRSHDDYQSFRELTRIFEHCWYGDRILNTGAFGQLEPAYRQFIDRISSPKTAMAS